MQSVFVSLVVASCVAGVFVRADQDKASPCVPSSYVASAWDGVNFIETTNYYDSTTMASLYTTNGVPGNYRVLDFPNGVVYSVNGGECTKYAHGQAAGLLAAASNPTNVFQLGSDDAAVPGVVNGFVFGTDDLTIRNMQTETPVCTDLFFSFSISGVPRMMFFYSDHKEATADDIQKIKDALAEIQGLDCKPPVNM